MTEECVLSIEAERLSYHYRILVDAAAELSGVRHPHRVLEAYLLSTLGGVGARNGFALLLGPTEQNLHVIRRPAIDDPGLDQELGEDLRELLTATDRMGPFFMRGCCRIPGYLQVMSCSWSVRWKTVGTAIGLGSPCRTAGTMTRPMICCPAWLHCCRPTCALPFCHQAGGVDTELERRTEIDRQVYHLNALGDQERSPWMAMQAVLDSMLWNMLDIELSAGLAFVIDGSSLLVSMKGLSANSLWNSRQVELLFTAL